jgi:hypothetical protein
MRLAGCGPDGSTSFVLHVSTSHSSRACVLRNVITKKNPGACFSESFDWGCMKAGVEVNYNN